MRALRSALSAFAVLASVVAGALAQTPAYIPQAQYCFPQGQVPPAQTPLCSTVPGDISPDAMLAGTKNGYKGIINAAPNAPENDVETPFDNYSWQVFVALNWLYWNQGAPPPAKIGLDGTTGPRVWQSWSRVSDVFGNSTVQAKCAVPAGYEFFSMGSNGKGQPVAQNEEYIQAATLKPAIDVNGNFTLYERRLNSVEIAYLKAPDPKNPNANLTTYAGQVAFVNSGARVDFPATGAEQNGAIEIKAAWRILDPAQHAANVKKYYVVRAVVGVPNDLVAPGTPAIVAPICAKVDLGLVAIHIIQKNVNSHNQLLPEWFWTTFEHVDNAPLAANACDITKPGTCSFLNKLDCPAATLPPGSNYSYFNALDPKGKTNQPADAGAGKAFKWNRVPPYAKNYLMPAVGNPRLMVGTQVSRCWQIYKLTQQVNAQWQNQLRGLGSVFANYMLIGTQWGANLEPAPPPGDGPTDAAPNYLSNSVVETFLQTFFAPGGKYSPFTTGSCVSCHAAATLVPKNQKGQTVSSNLSFLPGLVHKDLIRALPATPHTP